MKKLNEKQKVILTLGQLKRLIRESEEADYVFIPLGLTADKNIVKSVKPDVDGNPSPWSILDDLSGQLSDGKWENSPGWRSSGGILILKTSMAN